MSALLTAKEIAEQALRMVGAYRTSDSAADPEHLRVALTSLDLIMAEVGGTLRLFNEMPGTITMPLTAGQQAYGLSAELGSDYPVDGIQFPVDMWIENDGGARYPIRIVTRETFENVSHPDTTGVPQWVWVNRSTSPTLYTYPTLPADETVGYSLKMIVQTFAPKVAPLGVTGINVVANTQHGFRPAWQRYLIYRLAYDLGNGTIYFLPETRLNRWEKDMERAYAILEAFENGQHDNEPPVADPHGIEGYLTDDEIALRDYSRKGYPWGA